MVTVTKTQLTRSLKKTLALVKAVGAVRIKSRFGPDMVLVDFTLYEHMMASINAAGESEDSK